MVENGFQVGYLGYIEGVFNEKLPGSEIKGMPHIQLRVKWMKSGFQAFYDMRYGSCASGFGWDSERCVVLADRAM